MYDKIQQLMAKLVIYIFMLPLLSFPSLREDETVAGIITDALDSHPSFLVVIICTLS